MHTSWWIFDCWLLGIFLGIVAQICNYLSILKIRPKWCPSLLLKITGQKLRMWGFCLGVVATLTAGLAAYQAAIDWRTLPMITDGLKPGQLWDDGGVVVVIEDAERPAVWERLRRESR